jgi:hypothetical protein
MNSPAPPITRKPTWLERPWYPFVVAIYPLWFLYMSNLGQVGAMAVFATSLVAMAVVAALLWIAARLVKSRAIGALVVTAVVVTFYGYGPVHDIYARAGTGADMAPAARWLSQTLVNHAILTPVMLGLCALVITLILKRASRVSTQLTGACNFAAAALAMILLGRLGFALFQQDEIVAQSDVDVTRLGDKVSVLGYNPDIYYIIVDGYARADVLKEYYNFDNSGFLGGLEQRGFAVNDSSRTNYYWTFLSLASSLNFDYLQNIASPVFANPVLVQGRNGYEPIGRLAQDNRAAHFLRSRGYKFVHVRSSAHPTISNPYADEQVACDGSLFEDEFFRTLTEISWLKAIGSVATGDLAACHLQRLKMVADQAAKPGPKFVFAHFLPPHHPYLFDRDGNVLKRVTLSNQFDFQARLWEDKHGYLEQIQFTNKSLLALIDRIKAESKHPPIIIVQSDHGPNLVGGLSGLEARALRFANFAAYLLPGATEPVMPRDTAPVNQFRYLFNHYFNAGLPILPQRNFYSIYAAPLDMLEVTTLPPIGKKS